MKFAILGARAFEILCAAIVLGLSANMYKTFDRVQDICDALNERCYLGGVLPSIGYCAFVGAWGLLDALLGIAATFIEAIPFFIVSGVDSFAIVAFLAGGIVSLSLLLWLDGVFVADIVGRTETRRPSRRFKPLPDRQHVLRPAQGRQRLPLPRLPRHGGSVGIGFHELEARQELQWGIMVGCEETVKRCRSEVVGNMSSKAPHVCSGLRRYLCVLSRFRSGNE